LSEGTEVFHNNIRERWSRGDPDVVEAMKTWAGYAGQGKDCMLRGDYERLSELIDANFDLRARIYKIGEGNREMIETARGVGASANFAGSGGAIVGLYRGQDMFQRLTAAMQTIGVAVIEPKIAR
jgi:glucuronokinase